MTLTAVIAIYCSFLGTAVAAVVAYCQQRNLLNLLRLAQSEDAEDRRLVQFFEDTHRGFFLGMTLRQLCTFWSAIALIILGHLLFAIDATRWLLASGPLG